MDTTSADIDSGSQTQSKLKAKWGRAIGHGDKTGFVALPEVLVRSQKRLGISSTEMMVLINVLMHWWSPERKPFPGNNKIAKHMGVSTRTVQRAFETLEQKRLIKREISRYTKDDRPSEEDEIPPKTPYEGVRKVDLSGLVFALERIAMKSRDHQYNETSM